MLLPKPTPAHTHYFGIQAILCTLAPIYSFWIAIVTVRQINRVTPADQREILLPTFYYLVMAVVALDYVQMFSLLYAENLDSQPYKIFIILFRAIYRVAVGLCISDSSTQPPTR